MLIPTQVLVHSLRGKDERSPLTSLAKIYMSDVMDHCNTMVEDIDSMLSLCEKLINMVKRWTVQIKKPGSFCCFKPLLFIAQYRNRSSI